MKYDYDPLWYDREDPDEVMGLFPLLISAGVVLLARLMFLPPELWPTLKLATIAAFRDVEDLRR